MELTCCFLIKDVKKPHSEKGLTLKAAVKTRQVHKNSGNSDISFFSEIIVCAMK